MDISLFDYNLPEELIAQQPTRKRDQSRLMVVSRSGRPRLAVGAGSVADTHQVPTASGGRQDIKGIYPFKSIVNYFDKGDALVINNTKVFKARLLGQRKSGGQVEIFLIRKDEFVGQDPCGPANYERQHHRDAALRWIALVQPSRKLKEGEEVLFGARSIRLGEYYGEGRWLVEFRSQSDWDRIVVRFGHVPLPQYIKRDDQIADIRRYQTVYADKSNVGAVAAPTAGFHFTKPVLDAIRAKGVKIVELTLHVGPGTFKPVTADKVEDHIVDPEFAELSPGAASTLNSVRKSGNSIVAVGTTSVRTLESAKIVNGKIQPFASMVNLYIKPGYEFLVVDQMLTNFHLPKSSLLILVSAFAGRERILNVYKRAIEERMRFYSYGDCMLIF